MRNSLIVLLLAGCAATVPAPPIVTTTEIKVPVMVSCHVALPTAPVWEMSRMSVNASLFDLVKASVIELRQRQAYQAELEASAKTCE